MGHTTPASWGLTGGHCHECIQPSRASMSGTLSVKVFHLRMARGVGAELIPTLTSRRKLPTALFCCGKKGSTMAKSSWYGGAGLSFAPTASAVLSSCYLMKSSWSCLGTVLTLLRGRSVVNQKSLTNNKLTSLNTHEPSKKKNNCATASTTDVNSAPMK